MRGGVSAHLLPVTMNKAAFGLCVCQKEGRSLTFPRWKEGVGDKMELSGRKLASVSPSEVCVGNRRVSVFWSGLGRLGIMKSEISWGEGPEW